MKCQEVYASVIVTASVAAGDTPLVDIVIVSLSAPSPDTGVIVSVSSLPTINVPIPVAVLNVVTPVSV